MRIERTSFAPGGGPAGARPGILRPPFVYAASILAGVLLDVVWPLSFVPRAFGRLVGGALALTAAVLFAAAIRELRAAGTPGRGQRPTKVIVRTGPYRISRNPIYLAFSLLHLGVAAWIGSWWLHAVGVGLRYGRECVIPSLSLGCRREHRRARRGPGPHWPPRH